MKNVKRILVPVDFSSASRHAVEHAVDLAELYGATIDVLHVATPPTDYRPLDKWIWGDESDAHRIDTMVSEAADKALDRFVQSLPDAWQDKVTPKREIGIPSKVIVRRAKDEPYDLIVLATAGRTGVEHVLLGSVTQRVIRNTPCPVLTFRAPPDEG